MYYAYATSAATIALVLSCFGPVTAEVVTMENWSVNVSFCGHDHSDKPYCEDGTIRSGKNCFYLPQTSPIYDSVDSFNFPAWKGNFHTQCSLFQDNKCKANSTGPFYRDGNLPDDLYLYFHNARSMNCTPQIEAPP